MKRNKIALAILASFPLSISLAQSAHAQAAQAAPEQIEAIEVKGAFLGAGSKSAMKLDVPVRDTPFSVSSYTGSFMKAIETSQVADLYNYMNGVKRAGNTGYDLNVRGFSTSATDRNAILVDGLPGLTGRFGSPPTIGTDHIELVKGPLSVLYGQAQPGGFLNIITKKPKGVRDFEFEARETVYKGAGLKFGDRSGYVVGFDATGPIDADGIVLYRVIAEGTDRDTYRTNGYQKSTYFTPSLTWNVTDDTSATLQFEYRKTNTSYDQYLAAPNRDVGLIPQDIKTRYQEQNDYQKENDNTLVLTLNHAFDNGMTFNFGARSVKHKDYAFGFDSVDFRADQVTLQRRARGQYNERYYDFIDTNLNIPFSTGPFTHKLLIGVNGGREISDFTRTQFFNGVVCTPAVIASGQCLDVNIYNPILGQHVDLNRLPIGPLTRPYTISDSFGLYASDLITLSKQWKVQAGIRQAKERQEIQDRLPGSTVRNQYKPTSKVLPLAALLFQPTQQWTYYVSYATSYVPQAASAIDAFGQNPFVPSTAKQYEVGAKAESLLGGRVNVTTALFKIDKKNTLGTATCIGAGLTGCSQQIGAQQSKGFEIEVNAKPVKDWQITSGYAYTDAKVTESVDRAQIGSPLTNSAKNSFNIWSRYDIPTGIFSDVGIGVGYVYTGARNGFLPTTAANGVVDNRLMTMPSYSTVDLGIYYDLRGFAFTLKVANLFDKRYFASAGATPQVQVQPGEPRNLSLSVRTHF